MRVKNHRKIKAAPASLFHLGFRQAESVRKKFTTIHFGYENNAITSVDARNYRHMKAIGEFHAVVPKENRKSVYIELADFLGESALGEAYLVIDDPCAVVLFNNDVLSLNLDGLFFFLRADDFVQIRRRLDYVPKDDGILDEIAAEVMFGMEGEEEYFSHERKEALVAKPDLEALEVCAYIQNMIKGTGRDVSWLRFSMNPGHLVECSYRFSFFTFKVARDGKKYVFVPEEIARECGLPYADWVISDGAVRVYFASPKDLDALKDYIVQEYDKAYASFQKVLGGRNVTYASQFSTLANFHQLQEADVKKYLEAIEGKDYGVASAPEAKAVKKEDLTIKAATFRKPLADIQVRSMQEGDEGNALMKKADEARRKGNYEESIALLEECREMGFIHEKLYLAYSRTYHLMHDFENEIHILEEGIGLLEKQGHGMLGKRYDRALQSLARKQGKEQRKQQRREARDARKEKSDATPDAKRMRATKRVVKMDLEGNVLETYESVKEAAKANDIKPSTLYAVIQPQSKHMSKKYLWRYEEDIA